MFSKKITEISLKNSTINVERKLNLTRADVEHQLSKFDYSGEKLLKDPEVENAKLPPFIVSFYYCIFSKLTIPSEKEFIEEYYKTNEFKFEGNYVSIQGKKLSKEGVDARLLRTYPSLIRDFHFYLLLSESDSFDNVCYSLRRDYYDGLDLKIDFKNKEYFLSLHIGTERGEFFKLKKTNRHDYSDVREIILDVSFSSLKKHGAFYLLDDKHIEGLKSKLKLYDNGE